MQQKELTDLLDKASRDYYNGLSTELTDTEFDLKLKELASMEKESGIVYPNSPTLRVGSDIQEGFKKGKHPKPMLTIDNVYDDEGLEKWVNDMYRFYNVDRFNISVKYDGISCEIWYKDGVFYKALTRGDKDYGDDITENVRTIKNIPLVLTNGAFLESPYVYVRGEILLPKSELKKINEERIAEGLQPFSNIRNACSGSIKQLDPKVTAKRNLIFRAWDCFRVANFGNPNFSDMEVVTSYLYNRGFYYDRIEIDGKLFDTTPFMAKKNEVVEKVKEFKALLNRANLDYDFDGVVVKVNNIEAQEKIGTEYNRSIKWGIARKWNEENKVQTRLLGVEWQVGRTGVITPVARLEPVDCCGVIISNATLHNYGFITSLGIKIGDMLDITRSGGVIPYVLGVSSNNNPKEDKIVREEINVPNHCPICGGSVSLKNNTCYCTNEECPSIVKGKILYFCSKDCMDIKSLGDKVISDIVDTLKIRDIADFYNKIMSYDQFELAFELGKGYGAKSCEKIINALWDSKKQPFERVLAGLSIPGVGKIVAKTLVNKFKNIENFLNCTKEELISIDGIGDKMADDIIIWCHNDSNRQIVNSLCNDARLTMAIEEPDGIETNTEKELPLEGLKVCFSGSSSKYKGDEIEKVLESYGAKTSHSISGKVNFLITGENPGPSKVEKARNLQVPILTEQEFFEKFNLD